MRLETIALKQNYNSQNPSEDIARLAGIRQGNRHVPERPLRDERWDSDGAQTLKDVSGSYLWKDSAIFDKPVVTSRFMPTGSIVFGGNSYYWIVER